MSDDVIIRRLAATARELGRTAVSDRPAIRLPYSMRILNPFPLASSGQTAGDFPQSSAVVLLAVNFSVFVVTTNNGTNFWTIGIQNAAGASLGTVTTAAIAANTFVRLSIATLTQPASANVVLSPYAIATLNPGAIYIIPEVIVAQ